MIKCPLSFWNPVADKWLRRGSRATIAQRVEFFQISIFQRKQSTSNSSVKKITEKRYAHIEKR